MADVKIGVTGCAGRMGTMLVRQAALTTGCVLAAGSEGADNPALGQDIGELAALGTVGLSVTGDARALFAAADVVLDFTTPAATVVHAALAAESGTALVVGTTGLGAAESAVLEGAAAKVAIVQAANMSVGINLLLGLVRQVAGTLDADYDIEILEMHHRHKVDAPSGTALALGRAAAAGRGIEPADSEVRVRDGITGPRQAGTIGYATLRGGDVVGDHAVIFAAEGERLELAHKASSRQVFARGAIRAALWVAGRPPGLYGMDDVLGLGAG